MVRKRRLTIALVGGCLAATMTLLAWSHGRLWQQRPASAVLPDVEASRRCVAELERHDPKADADRDFARGDLTPIGTTYVPHDPPEPSTLYEGACGSSYADAYRPTGKWFTYTSSGYSSAHRSDFDGRCQAAARRYVLLYNSRMTARAADATKRFCAAQKFDRPARTAAGTEAAFGPAIRRRGYVGGAIIDAANGHSYLTKPSWLMDTAVGPVLATESRTAADVSACPDRGCVEAIGIVYLAERGQRMTMTGRWPTMLHVNKYGWSYSSMSCCAPTARTLHTELAVSEAISRDGCRAVRETLIELTPHEPILRGVIPIAASRIGGAGGENTGQVGKVSNVVKGKSFDIVVPSTGIVEHYQFRDGQFVGPARSSLAC